MSHGGAIYLTLNSTFSILSHTTVCWEDNHATFGGAIYVADVKPLDLLHAPRLLHSYKEKSASFT